MSEAYKEFRPCRSDKIGSNDGRSEVTEPILLSRGIGFREKLWKYMQRAIHSYKPTFAVQIVSVYVDDVTACFKVTTVDYWKYEEKAIFN